MADDLRYVPGDFYRICDRTGFKVRASATSKEWTSAIVRSISSEPRHPQDFVRGVTDDQTVQDARPRQTDVFIGPLQTTVAVAAAAGANVIAVTSTAGMANSDRLEIILDSKDTFLVTVSAVASPNITISTPLPSSVAAGNLVTDISQVVQPNIG